MAELAIHFRFHGELNDFLNAPRRNLEFEHPACPTDTVKHVLESLGVPHTEVGQVLVNGLPRDLSEPLTNGDRVEVFPQPVPILLKDPRFVIDGHLGRLDAYLRMLGFDCWYGRFADDAELAHVAARGHRILLTRDIGLLKRKEVQRGYFVRSDKPHVQLREVTTRFALHRYFAPFTRCMACNGTLQSIPKQEVADLLPPHTRETKNEFSQCTDCGKVYWRGSHHARMLGWIEDLVEQQPRSTSASRSCRASHR